MKKKSFIFCKKIKRLAVCLLLGLLLPLANAEDVAAPPPAMADESTGWQTPQQQTTYNTLINELRCLVCQNQSIAESGADLARDMRTVVRTMVAQGQDADAIVAAMVARYGDFVRYQPPLDWRTAALWLLPFALAAAGLWWLPRWVRRRQQARVRLSAEDAAYAEKLLKDDK